jgi:hypothetical protein
VRRPQGGGFYLAQIRQEIVLPVSPELGHPEHNEFRWATCTQAKTLPPPRLQPILDWARQKPAG